MRQEQRVRDEGNYYHCTRDRAETAQGSESNLPTRMFKRWNAMHCIVSSWIVHHFLMTAHCIWHHNILDYKPFSPIDHCHGMLEQIIFINQAPRTEQSMSPTRYFSEHERESLTDSGRWFPTPPSLEFQKWKVQGPAFPRIETSAHLSAMFWMEVGLNGA